MSNSFKQSQKKVKTVTMEIIKTPYYWITKQVSETNFIFKNKIKNWTFGKIVKIVKKNKIKKNQKNWNKIWQI